MPSTFARLIASLLAATALLSAFAANAQTADYGREKRWADEIVPSLMVGDAVWLQAAGQRKFLALYSEAAASTKRAKGAVILVHGLGVHPDFGVIGQMRSRLADAGYTTLSVQMPILAASAEPDGYPALFAEAAERLAAAVVFLQGKGERRIALVSHSMGSRMANRYLALDPAAPLSAWVSLAISTGQFEPIGPVKFPVFDVYAERDFDVVRANVRKRARFLRDIPGSRQAMVDDTDHYFAKKEKELAKLVERLLESPK